MRAGLPDRRAGPGARRGAGVPDRSVDSVCPYCGVGCQLTYHVKDDHIVRVDGRDGPANQGRLCVKGRYGFDYARHPQRLTVPLIRRADAPKDATRRSTRATRAPCSAKPAGTRRWRWPAARCADPRHARAEGAGRFRLGQGQQRRGLPVPEAGAPGLRQQQRRPLHAAVPRVQRGGAAGRHRLGRGQQPGDGREQAEVVIVIGANPTVNHPVAATWIKNAVRRARSWS
jgi:formate dehydrogenase major subunit